MSADSAIDLPRNPLPIPPSPDIGEPRFTLAIGCTGYADFARRSKATAACMERYARHPDQTSKQGPRLWLGVLTWFIIGIVLFWGFKLAIQTEAYVWFGNRKIILKGSDLVFFPLVLFVPGYVAALVVALISVRLYRRALYALNHDNTETLIMGERGIQHVSDAFTANVPWHGIGQVVDLCDLTVIIGRRVTYYVSIPDAAFADAAQRAQCLQFIRERVTAAQRGGAGNHTSSEQG